MKIKYSPPPFSLKLAPVLMKGCLFLSCYTVFGCDTQTNALDGQWQVNEDATFALYAANRGSFEILPRTHPAWGQMKKACFMITNGNQLHIVTQHGDDVSAIRIEGMEPKVWKVSVDSADYPFSIKVAVVAQSLRVLDAGHLFVWEKTCQRE